MILISQRDEGGGSLWLRASISTLHETMMSVDNVSHRGKIGAKYVGKRKGVLHELYSDNKLFHCKASD